eukprot:Seg1187.4 transcript_id=Seg1187.4/GoldUCD/mRNA.D3Y31 product="hypothetical protein" protein_id=Seg1187.4/GoldUCD/D3Y31
MSLPLNEELGKFENFRRGMLDIILSIVKEFSRHMSQIQSENKNNQFSNRTTVYRTDDGQPICYCCLKVGHVAKYCRHRLYSVPHNLNLKPPKQKVDFYVTSVEAVHKNVSLNDNYETERIDKDMQNLREIKEDLDNPRRKFMPHCLNESSVGPLRPVDEQVIVSQAVTTSVEIEDSNEKCRSEENNSKVIEVVDTGVVFDKNKRKNRERTIGVT